MTPFLLTASQAQELHMKGRLTGYREKCEWQPHPTEWRGFVKEAKGRWWFCNSDHVYSMPITLPRDTDTVYPVSVWAQICSDPAFPLPTGQHARITDIKLIISAEGDGELWWDFGDLEKVAKNGK